MAALKWISREEIKALYDAGMTQREIADKYGVSQKTISRRLEGYSRHYKGGLVSSQIPRNEYVSDAIGAEPEMMEKRELAEKNASNACLVVEDRTISLAGTVGRYEVSLKDQMVFAILNDMRLELKFDVLKALSDEFRAIARNVAGMENSCEMW